jgi:hypothetical protein
MKRRRRSAVGTALLAVVACNVYDPSLLSGGDTLGTGAVGGSGGKGGKAGSAGGAGVGGTQQAGGSGTAGNGVGGTGVAGSSLAQGGANGGGSAGLDNQGGASAEGGEGGTNEAGNDAGGTGGDSGRGGGAGTSASGAGSSGTSGRGGTSGAGGTAGSGGSSGTGGSAGSGGSSGTGGSSGAGGSAGGPPITANGCAKLTVTIDDAADVAHFPISFTTSTGLDFGAAVITMRVYAPAASGGAIFNYVQDLTDYHYLGDSNRPAFKAGWQTVTWNVGTQALGTSQTNKAKIKRIGIEVNAGTATSWANPTVLYVDSITVAMPTETFTFDSSSTLNTTATTTDPSTTVLWINNHAEDTTATGVALSWVATCP